MNEIIGSFYFRLTENGNLAGEFTNNESNEIITEGGNLEGGEIDARFIGTYITSWVENDQSCIARLKISNPDNSRKFTLVWRDI
ncbi:hypothetical protein [Owenweeksia hongkongensis]|uniref:hypothetical protein n=1 Tax=Owenweeksia hongkongensis TaxID=253245 RepID=UPI003A8E8834